MRFAPPANWRIDSQECSRSESAWADPPIHTRLPALRIAVNDELGQLDAVASSHSTSWRLSRRHHQFHLLEDRRTKWAFKTDPTLTAPDQQTCYCDGPGSDR